MNDVFLYGHDLIDKVEKLAMMAVEEMAEKYNLVNCPLEHRFTGALYSREIKMPEGALVISQTHKTEHQFIISEGVASVWTEEAGWQILVAPYHGITKAGTRRILKIEADCVWTTFHSTLLQTVEDIDSDIIEKRINPLIGGTLKENRIVKSKDQREIHY